MRPLILGLGNELLGDDGVGIMAAFRLAKEISPTEADIQICRSHGITLLDYMSGYDKAIIIDALDSRQEPVGSIVELAPDDFQPVANPSPHYTGLPELIVLARELELPFPRDIIIFGITINNSHTIGKGLTAPVHAAVELIVGKVKYCLNEWQNESRRPKLN